MDSAAKALGLAMLGGNDLGDGQIVAPRWGVVKILGSETCSLKFL
jgi:hypothetical protein